MLFRKKRKPPSAPLRRHLDMGDRTIPFDLVRSDRRTLGVQVKRDGTVVVRAPRRITEAAIHEWVAARHKWIDKHRENFRKTRTPLLKYVAGERHFLLGEALALEIETAGRGGAYLEGDRMIVKTRYPFDREKTEALVKTFYRRQAADVFPGFIEDAFPPFADMGYKLPNLKLRWMKRHWGSLSAHGVMTLNTKLIRAPRHLIDYVIIHELCHLAHMNHGKGFYTLQAKMMPDWKARKKALEQFLA